MNVSQPISVLQRYSGGLVPLVDQTYSAGSFVLTWASKQFKKLVVVMDWNAGGIANIALAGMNATSFGYAGMYTAAGSAVSAISGNNAANWALNTGSGATSPGEIAFDVDLLSASSKKALHFNETDAFVGTGVIVRVGGGQSSDTVVDPTQMTITLDASRTGSIKIWGLT